MEYVEGVDLKALVVVRRVQNVGPLSVAAACEVVRQAAAGLQYACEKGLVHRDIKPANLMLSRSGVVKILDLGLAKLRSDCRPADDHSDTLTQAGATIGTVDYMAPEQWEDPGKVDIRADMYGLGCTLYYLLTGNVVYRADTVGKKILAHRGLPAPSLCEFRPDVPPALDAIFHNSTVTTISVDGRSGVVSVYVRCGDRGSQVCCARTIARIRDESARVCRSPRRRAGFVRSAGGFGER